MGPRFAVLVLLVPCILTGVGCGGGSGGSAGDSGAYDLGLVSGTRPTVRTLPIENPLEVPATPVWPIEAGPFTVDAATLPATDVAPGDAVDVDVVLTPGAAGPVSGSVLVRFVGGGQSSDVVLSLRATVEQVRVVPLQTSVDFGSVQFGAMSDRVVSISNACALSVVTFTGLSAPTPDLEIVSPALPLVLPPGGRQEVVLRASPYRSMAPVNGTCRIRAASTQGAAEFNVRMTPLPGRKVVDLGLFGLTDGSTDVIDIEVPAHVWSLHVAAWRPGALLPHYETPFGEPDPAVELVTLAVFRSPSGMDHHNGWMAPTRGAFAATLPRSARPQDQLDAGGGTYQVQFDVSDMPAADAKLAVRAVLKATVDGQAPTTATLDLNIWLGSQTGVTPASAPLDGPLQAALLSAGQMLQQVGITIGNIDYYAYTEYTGGGLNVDTITSIRDALPTGPGLVADRLNLFMPASGFGQGGRQPGPFCAYSNHSFCIAGYLGVNVPYLIVHEGLHHLGLPHVWEDVYQDTWTGSLPANVMDSTLGQGGSTFISPEQGLVIRAHPFLR